MRAGISCRMDNVLRLLFHGNRRTHILHLQMEIWHITKILKFFPCFLFISDQSCHVYIILSCLIKIHKKIYHIGGEHPRCSCNKDRTSFQFFKRQVFLCKLTHILSDDLILIIHCHSSCFFRFRKAANSPVPQKEPGMYRNPWVS